jgi:hypothetical protein
MVAQEKCSRDPIPEKAIRISEAFDSVLQALRDNPQVLETLDPHLRDYLTKNRKAEEQRDHWRSRSTKSKETFHAVKQAVVFFRSILSEGKLTAYIRDTNDGSILQLDTADWSPVGGRLMLLEPPYAFEDDFLDSAPFSGNPNTFIRGARRPVFLWRKEFELWLSKTFEKKLSVGRPTGSGSYEVADRPFLEKMRQLLETREAKSVNYAAKMVAKNLPRQNAQEQSIITRLAKRYNKLHRSG